MLLGLRLKLGEKLFGYVGDPPFYIGVRVAPKRMIKWNCEEAEVEGMLYAAANTSIPIPKLYKVHKYRGRLAVEMEYITGCEILWTCWRSLTPQQQLAIVEEVSDYVMQLRKLDPPNEQRVSSTAGGPFRDLRIGPARRCGPFVDCTAFHQFMRSDLEGEAARSIFDDKVMQIHGREYQIRFTHGDLDVQNILIRDGKVAAMLDWECSGWFPEYWEYTKAHYNSVFLPEFYEMLRRKLDRYDAEMEAERHLWRLMDDSL